MKLVFCGTPDFAVPSLQALIDAGHEIPLVLTQPDRPAGRKQEIHIPPVKQLALSLGLPILQPERLKTNPELRALLEQIAPDAIIVVAYGRIIPQSHAMATSTSMDPSSRNTEEPPPSSGPSPTAKPKPV
jgi:methionyl-tRNA formyltransferase